ncbi:MAG: glycosyltransferase [Candidatus Hodarchaeota archaeon]
MKLLNLGCGTRFHPAWINVDIRCTGPDVIPCDVRQGIPFIDDSFDAIYHSHLLEHFRKEDAHLFMRDCFRVLKPGGIIRVVVPDLEEIVRIYLKLLKEVDKGDEETRARYDWMMLELIDQMVRDESGGEMLKYCRQKRLSAAEFVVERLGSELFSILSSMPNIDKSTSISESVEDLVQATELDALKIGQFRLSGETHQWMYDRYSLKVLLEEAGFHDIEACPADESSIPNFSSYLLDIEEDGWVCKPGSLFMEARKPSEAPNQISEKGLKDFGQLHAAEDKIAQLSVSGEDRINRLLKEIHKLHTQLADLRDIGVREREKLKGKLGELSRVHQLALRSLPLVSIVTPVFNGAKWIEPCIKSVLSQDYPKIEHIIVDGGSTDSTVLICQSYPHLIVHSEKDRGQSHAINKGFAMAQGDILAWLCSDDEFEPGAIYSAVRGIMSGHSVVMGFSRFIDAVDRVLGEHPANAYSYYDHAMLVRFWKYNTISQPATFWTRRMWDTCGPLKESLYFAMDYDLWLKMSQRSAFERVNAYTAKYRIHPEAKCFSDNYRPRIELIKVSRQYWPSRWKPGFWKLHLGYLFSRGEITQHFTDGERLLQKSMRCLDDSKRLKAIFLFVKAHYKHFATPFLPNYKLAIKGILKEGVGPAWFWRFGNKIWHFLRKKNE